MAQDIHSAAVDHLPVFIVAPGHTDYLSIGVVIFLIAMILAVGNLYFQLHAFPERMAHRASKVQMEIVAVLALISLFTHNHLFWIAALLLAFVHIPDFSTPLYSIAQSLGKLAGRDPETSGDPALMADAAPKPIEGNSKSDTHREGA
ncbi:hypothetical protein FHT86_002804 [Rhizobium sp. BK313]|jgi:hypothetical protein|uniref:hypothetical protein n=1 Tax=Rhizobium sp. BK313 TaxID=2587081 RepID=UPI00105E307F|nr:hypothetical protein [Rhizobium sp. BK313]MBB3454505.1 hypothetical protein [Rhizobium sp. BK313]